jgi:hypothetical protein
MCQFSLQPLELLNEHGVKCVEILSQFSCPRLLGLHIPQSLLFFQALLLLLSELVWVGFNRTYFDDRLTSQFRLVEFALKLETCFANIFRDIWLDSVEGCQVHGVGQVKSCLIELWLNNKTLQVYVLAAS